MKSFIPLEKLGKKERRRLNTIKRGSWNGVIPVTRVVDNDKRKYKRKLKYGIEYE